uniref:Putative ovule protein n=1 Tax=Solanum chacoense TaxID=4108 RepID=A0A0V0HF63_SOLCH
MKYIVAGGGDGRSKIFETFIIKIFSFYGELAQATYDTFTTERASKYAGASRYSMENFFTKGRKLLIVFSYTKLIVLTVHANSWDCFVGSHD